MPQNPGERSPEPPVTLATKLRALLCTKLSLNVPPRGFPGKGAGWPHILQPLCSPEVSLGPSHRNPLPYTPDQSAQQDESQRHLVPMGTATLTVLEPVPANPSPSCSPDAAVPREDPSEEHMPPSPHADVPFPPLHPSFAPNTHSAPLLLPEGSASPCPDPLTAPSCLPTGSSPPEPALAPAPLLPTAAPFRHQLLQ